MSASIIRFGWFIGICLVTINVHPTASQNVGGQTWVPQSSGTDIGLRDVYFVGRRTGWVVGSGGVILQTIDGGQTWSQQLSGTDVKLEAVHFTDPQNGWIVSSPSGPILHTFDGGQTWEQQSNDRGLYNVYFISTKTGWAVGHGSEEPAGLILSTTNGG